MTEMGASWFWLHENSGKGARAPHCILAAAREQWFSTLYWSQVSANEVLGIRVQWRQGVLSLYHLRSYPHRTCHQGTMNHQRQGIL